MFSPVRHTITSIFRRLFRKFTVHSLASRPGSRRRQPARLWMEFLEDRLAPTATPTAALLAPSTNFLGQDVNMSVAFTNTGTTVGYGPYLDVDLPANGADGPTHPDGITYNVGSATYLGSPVTATLLTFDATGHATHPYALDSSGNPIILTGKPGDQVVVFQLPFGSFTPGQTSAVVSFTAHISNLAAVGTPLTLATDGGFQYGNDPLNDPTIDPTILGGSTSQTLTPTLLTVTKTYLGPEQETATGPNFPHQYVVDVSVAPGQTITNLDVTDLLPNNLQFVSVDSTSIDGTAATTTAINTPSTTTPGGTLTRRFASVTGTGAANDAEVVFTFYVPENDANGNPVLDLTSGAFAPSSDTASASGTWTPIATFHTGGTVTSNVAVNTITDKSIAIQKTVTDMTHLASPMPDDTLSYTLNIQVSDFFAFQNIIAQETYSDGQQFNAGFTPILNVHGDTFALNSDAFHSGNDPLTYATFNPATGGNQITFNLSNELIADGQPNGQLLGGALPTGGTAGPIPPANPTFAGTTATITFETTILTKYNVLVSASGDPHVKQGDLLNDSVSVTGNVLSYANLTPDGNSQTDTSAASVQINRGQLSKIIYAINGVVAPNPNTGYANGVQAAAGETITYRLRYSVLFGNAETIALTDYLPLPVLLAGSLTTFDFTGPTATPPASGHAVLGLSDTLTANTGAAPTLSSDPTANSVVFSYPTSHDPQLRSAEVDILYTIPISNSPFADGLFLTNEVHETEGSTDNGGAFANSIIQFDLTEPVLAIKKGIVSTNDAGASYSQAVGPTSFTAPGSSGPRFTSPINSAALATQPIDANITGGLQAGDKVTFADVVQNTGTGLHGAYNVTIADVLPPGFINPTNIEVTDGNGTPLAYTGNLFGSGIVLTDPPANPNLGALAPYSANSGQNLVIITYDATAGPTVEPNQLLDGSASVTNYGSVENGPNFVPNGISDDATLRLANITVNKAVVNTSESFTTGTNLAIGEEAQYQVTITLPQGEATNATLVDTPDAGLGFVSLDSISASSALSTSFGNFNTVLTNAQNSLTGTQATCNFGTLTNSDTNNTTAETITLTYTVVALNTSTNASGDTDKNDATFKWDDGSVSKKAPVTIVEPNLTVTVTPSVTSGQAGTPVTYTLVVSNPNNAPGTDSVAFKAALANVIPAGVDYVAGSLQFTGGVAPAAGTLQISGNDTISANWSTLTWGQTATITFQGVLDNSVSPTQPLVDKANLQWTSLPNALPQAPESTYNSLSVQRTGSAGDAGGSANTYDANATDTITVFNVAPVKAIVGTSEAFTGMVGGVQTVTIGEVVRYRLQVQLPNSTMNNFQLVDPLPAGLGFVNSGSGNMLNADLVLIADQPMTLPADLTANYSSTGNSATTPTVALDPNDITFNGQTVTFSLGNLVNNDTDSTPAYATLDFDVLVLNSNVNQAGDVLTNGFDVFVNNTQLASNTVNAKIVEPNITNTLTESPAGADSGDTVTYTAVFTNNGSSPGFDSNFSDLLPNTVTLISHTVTSGGGTAGLHDTSSGNQLSLGVDTIPVGGSVSITFKATVNSTGTIASPGSIVPDSDTVTTTTLPGTGTTPNPTGEGTPGASGAANGERTGSGGVNNLFATGNASFTINTNSVTGYVYQDNNDDGKFESPGEPGLSGVSVTLTGTNQLNQEVKVTTTTNGSGYYSFGSLRPGTYTVTETAPAGYLNGIDSFGTPFGGSNATPLVLSNLVIPHDSNTTGLNYDFAELVPSTFSGTVFNDFNDNGVIAAPDTYISGVTITLTGTDDQGHAVHLTTTTNASGYYAFTGLRPSNASGYTVVETQPAGLLQGTDIPGNGSTLIATDTYKNVLPSNTVSMNNNFGELPPSSLSGTVYRDANNNGTFDPGPGNPQETGLTGITITLTGTDDHNNPVHTTAVTNGSGSYTFTNLRPGTYTITETPPAGFGPDTPAANVGNQGGTFGGPAITVTRLKSGVLGMYNNFGELTQPPTINPNVNVSINPCLGQSLVQTVSFNDAVLNGVFTATVNYGDGTVQTINLGTAESFLVQHSYAANGNYQVMVTITDAVGQSVSGGFLVDADAIGLVGSSSATASGPPVAVINDGSMQRSMINSITLSFGQITTVNTNLITLKDLTTNSLVGLRFITAVSNGQTVVMLQFTGSGIVGGSLANGSYQLSYNGTVLAGGTFFRLFGDVNGDGKVNETDLVAFSNAMRSTVGTPKYVWYLNYNQDCQIDAVDYMYFMMDYQP